MVRPGAILITGATSSMARAIAERYARRGCRLVLAARDKDECERLAGDLALRTGATVRACRFDALDFDSFPRLIDETVAALDGRLDGLIVCHGFMASQAEAERDPALARRMMDTNYTSAALLIDLAVPSLTHPGGFVAAISSVAGDRGRPSNFIYGSTKAALNTYLDGLRAALFKEGITVTTIKPGFVDTAMTWGMPGMFLVGSPDKVAADVERGIRRKRAVVYTPWFWWGIMTIIRSIPGFVFNRMKL
jgi:short-subunit dehydrogenase